MQEFSLNEYLANPERKVVTRTGCDVEIINTNGREPYLIVGYIADGQAPLTWCSNGRFLKDTQIIHSRDLFFADEESEEADDKVDDICKLIEHATIIPRSGDDDTGIPPTRLNDKYKGELKAFVKSLRNCPTKSDTWKPSEEQLKVDLDFQVFAKEMDAVFNLPKGVTENTEENPLNWEYAIARHFYELGKNAKK